MVSIVSLWMPILLSAAIVFVASSIIHMVFGYHRNDFGKVADEDDVMEALRRFRIPPGDYVIPHASDSRQRSSPEFKEKMEKGPVAFVTVLRNGTPSMAGSLVQWFIYCVVVGIIAAYITSRALEPGAHYLSVFRFAGVSAFLGHALALWQGPIWYKRRWSSTVKSTIDGLIYALLTAGVFGWLWPGR